MVALASNARTIFARPSWSIAGQHFHHLPTDSVLGCYHYPKAASSGDNPAKMMDINYRIAHFSMV
jgi:hypothetical protein